MLLGLLRADAGTARLLGGDPWREATTLHRRLAYVPGDVTLWPNLSGGEVIDLLGRLRGGLTTSAGPSCWSGSTSTRRRAAPTPRATGRRWRWSRRSRPAWSCCILDEPTSGLDPLMEAVFREAVEELRQNGRTVLLSSHILSEVEALCDRVTIIRAGRTVETGALAELRHLTRTSIDAELAGPPPDSGRAGRRARPRRRRATGCAARWTARPLARCCAC